MCYGCYEEAGSPKIINEKTKRAAMLITNLYEQPGCGAGGYAHVVVDDWNLDDIAIGHCIASAEKGEFDWVSENGRIASLDTLRFLAELTEDERVSALAIVDNFINTK